MDGIEDQGARLVSALASVIKTESALIDEAALEAEIDAVLDTLVDPAGTFYRFSMAHSMLRKAKQPSNGSKGNGHHPAEVVPEREIVKESRGGS